MEIPSTVSSAVHRRKRNLSSHRKSQFAGGKQNLRNNSDRHLEVLKCQCWTQSLVLQSSPVQDRQGWVKILTPAGVEEIAALNPCLEQLHRQPADTLRNVLALTETTLQIPSNYGQVWRLE